MKSRLSAAAACILSLSAVRRAAAQGMGWGETVTLPPVRTLSIALALMALTLLGALMMYLVSMEEEHWNRGEHS